MQVRDLRLSEVLTAAIMKITVFLDVTLCIMVDRYQRSEETFCLRNVVTVHQSRQYHTSVDTNVHCIA
jgi:ABC-type uncharacterized transport system permease subunit